MSEYRRIEPADIAVRPLAERQNQLRLEQIVAEPLVEVPPPGELDGAIDDLAGRIVAARSRGSAVVLCYGAHLVKNGCGPLVNWLSGNGWVTHVATHGAGIIHDWEFAAIGESSESVRNNTPAGRFGTWDETGRAINLAALVGGANGWGLGEAMGRLIEGDGLDLPAPSELRRLIADRPDDPLTPGRADLLAGMTRASLHGGFWPQAHPHKAVSIPAGCRRAGVPMSVHPGIGYDIYACHPLFSPAAVGRTSGLDFHRLVRSVMDLTGGVYLSVGSAIMSPQVFEKSLSLANNIRLGRDEPSIRDHTVAIVDIQDDGGWDWSAGEPPKDHPAYYLRFCKSFYRLADTVRYLRGDNRLVLAKLVARLAERES